MLASPLGRLLFVSTLLTVVLALTSCTNDDDLVRPQNEPPDTTLLMQGPYEATSGRQVLLEWSGVDDHGAVSRFEVRLIRPGENRDAVDWELTEERQRRVEFSAEELAKSNLFFEFEVRALDAGGLRDPSPASSAFSPITQPPTVQIEGPVSNSCVLAPTNGVVRWNADDPDTKEDPESTRYLVLEVGGPNDACLTLFDFERDNPFTSIPTSDPRWSDWVEYDAEDPVHPSRSLGLQDLSVGSSYLIAVQARDVDGAINKRFRWGENVVHLRISDATQPPLLEVFEPLLGLEQFLGVAGTQSHDVVANGNLAFQWDAESGPFGEPVDGYRVGVHVIDPDDPNDPGWRSDWGATQELEVDLSCCGTQNVIIQARTLSGEISRATYLFQIVQRPDPSVRRDLLLVDDWRNVLGNPSGDQLEAEQDAAWATLLDAIVPGDWDVIDAQTETSDLDLEKVLGYRAVIWFVNASDLSFMHSRFGPTAQGQERYDWLEMAQRHAIPLMVVGPGAAWSRVEHSAFGSTFPFVFDVPDGGNLGAGVLELPSGETIHRGTLRAPYRSFCVDLFSQIRPPAGGIFGENAGEFLRTLGCDALLFADPAPELATRLPGAPSVILRPTAAREILDPHLQLMAEEFYDLNVTDRSLDLTSRDCKVPMFRLRSRRSGDLGIDPASCSPPGESSPIEEAPVALASFFYSDTRVVTGLADFLWGFNPLGFRAEDVQVMLDWILREHWGLGS